MNWPFLTFYMEQVIDKIAAEIEWDYKGVESAVNLIDKGKTIHFIARYRKDNTNGLSADKLREIQERVEYLRKLETEKTKSIEKLASLDLLSDQLKDAIQSCQSLTDVKEIMQPYRSKRKTRASIAREKGLQPIADVITGKKEGKLPENEKEKIAQALDIVAEESINHPTCKRIAEKNIIRSKLEIKYDPAKDNEKKYLDLAKIKSNPGALSPHQIHALFRAEDEDIIKLKFNPKTKVIENEILVQGPFNPPKSYLMYFKKGLSDGIKRLLIPRADRSVRNSLKERADKRAIEVFKQNLENLLLQPPIVPKVIMGIDPGYKSGCKVAVIGKTGELLGVRTIFPTPPRSEIQKSGNVVEQLCEEYDVKFIAIGNGTGSAETLNFIKNLVLERNLVKINYSIISETGASVYSASKTAIDEFPDLEEAERGAISIARRVLDPLVEYVKIDPKSLGVGQYQHDVDQNDLDDALTFIVEKCVNQVGINLDTASKKALQYISGMNSNVTENIVEYRNEYKFNRLDELRDVFGVGDKIFEQASGFLRLQESNQLLDRTLIHPEFYEIALKIIANFDKNVFSWNETPEYERIELLKKLDPKDFTQDDAGIKVVEDIFEELILFGRDPRGIREFQDLSKQPSNISELEEGMILDGEIRNVVDFGAFVDIGIKQNGLIHISQMADRFVSNTHSICKIGDFVKVRVIDIDNERGRIGLKLIEVNGKTP